MYRSSNDAARRASGSEAKLTLGVKGRLSNQEMDQLKQQLAQAVAYNHVPVKDRPTKPTSTPMTRVYHRLEPETAHQQRHQHFRPSIKPKAAIDYEKRFAEGSYDSQRMRPAPKGIAQAARTVLQDEYVTRPREISVIPQNKHVQDEPELPSGRPHQTTGKRHAQAAIPRVFIL